MLSTTPLDQFCQTLQQIGRLSGHRYLLMLSGPRDWAEQMLAPVLAPVINTTVLLGDAPFCGIEAHRQQRVLGSEQDIVLIDAHTRFDINGALAAAGGLRSGGLLCLISPEWSAWPKHYREQCAGEGLYPVADRFLQRLLGLLQADSRVLHIQPGKPLPALPLAGEAWQQPLPSSEQQHCIDAIGRVATGRNKRPLVIRADRGRGKSAALGLAAAELLKQGKSRIVITAARFNMVEIAFRHAHSALPEAQRSNQGLHWGEGSLVFVPAAELTNHPDDVDLVMVDEAANLPLFLLTRFITRFSRIVFASTAQGYEGSGRGFDLRFRNILNELRPQWRRAQLNTPLRWAGTDPLESLLNDLFLLSTPATNGVSALISPSSPTYRWLDLNALAKDETRLKQVFALLIDAHYQTTPQDLQYLLDMPVRLLIAESSDRVVGVCQVNEEGGFGPALAADICRGKRRPKGHLAAQRLALISGNDDYLIQPSWRISRIAVATDCRRKGVGAALLHQAEETAANTKAAFISSSFAADPAIQQFWRNARFATVSLGSRLDTSSASYSVLVLRPLTEQVSTALGHWQQQLADNLLANAPLLWPRLRADVAADLLREMAVRTSDFDHHQCRRYARGEVTLEVALASLKRAVVGREQTPASFIGKCFLHWEWSRVCEEFNHRGRADCEAEFRHYFATLTADFDN